MLGALHAFGQHAVAIRRRKALPGQALDALIRPAKVPAFVDMLMER
ncbi:hypothetical protein [Pigmentiphaga litoralis]